jgi:hypothetical protein
MLVKTAQILIKPASAIVAAAFLAFPMLSLAQSEASPFGDRAAKPVCVYKGVMSDAEIELCTGYRIHYNYALDSGRTAVRASTGGTVQQSTRPVRTSRPRVRAAIITNR